jgi:hypothetical protein
VREQHEDIVESFRRQNKHEQLIQDAKKVIQKYENLVAPRRTQSTRATSSLAAGFVAATTEPLSVPESSPTREVMPPEVTDAYITLLLSDSEFANVLSQESDFDTFKTIIESKLVSLFVNLPPDWVEDLARIIFDQRVTPNRVTAATASQQLVTAEEQLA